MAAELDYRSDGPGKKNQSWYTPINLYLFRHSAKIYEK
jgi:hypothetical protein